jgi:hypothetical protein
MESRYGKVERCSACKMKLDDKHEELKKRLTLMSKETLQNYRNNSVVVGVEWLASPDSCDFCKSREGKVFKLDDKELLDHLDREHELCLNRHCRCSLLSVLRESE